jgi:polyphenol oxidase
MGQILDCTSILPALGQSGGIYKYASPDGVSAFVSTVECGGSSAPYGFNNTGLSTGESSEIVARNRDAIFSKIGCSTVRWASQIHSGIVMDADSPNHTNGVECDALVCTQPGVLLCVGAADCGNILLCQPGHSCAAVHAGWKGAKEGVLINTINALAKKGSCPEKTLAWIGPMIRQKSYPVGKDCASYFPQKYIKKDNGILKLDLHLYLVNQLEDAGISVIYDYGADTYCNRLFYSYRRENITGRFMAGIAFKAI